MSSHPDRSPEGSAPAASGGAKDGGTRGVRGGVLADLEGQLRVILDNIPDLAWLKDRDGRFLAVNEPFARACGVPAAALAGLTDFDVWPSTLAERYREDDREVLRTGEQRRLEEPLQHEDGRLLWIETVKSPIRGPGGEIAGTVGIARDISERRLLEDERMRVRDELQRQLEERTARLEAAYDELVGTWDRERLAARAGRTAVWDVDVATGEVYAGPGLAVLLGAEDGIVPPTLDAWEELLPAEDAERFRRSVGSCLSAGQTEVTVEHRLLHRDGTYRWFLTRGAALRDDAGTVCRVLGTSTDITHLRRTDMAIRLLHEADQRVLRREPLGELLRFLAAGLAACLDLPFVRLTAVPGPGAPAAAGAAGAWAPALGADARLLERLETLGTGLKTAVLLPRGDPELVALGEAVSSLGATAALVLPLTGGEERTVGTLAALATPSSALGEAEVTFLTEVAGQVALTLVDAGHLERLELLTAALEAAANAVLIAGADGRVRWVNRAFTVLTGLSPTDVTGRPDPALVDPGDGLLLSALGEGRVFREETMRTRADGTAYIEEQTVTPFFGPDGGVRHVIAIRQDVTARRRDEERLRHLALHDPLTDLPNRQVMERSLERMVARACRGTPGTLALIDIDRFKAINDALGHAAGDQVLVEMARFLAHSVRPGDEVARLGDDEYVVLLEGIPAEAGQAMAERLRREVDARRLTIGERSLDLSVSVGVVPVDGRLDVPSVLALADAALAEAKERGRNRVVVFDGRSVELDALTGVGAWVSRIKDAVRHDRFVLVFQPVCELGTGRAVHHEALLRLRGDDGGLVGTAAFLPVAERFGLLPQVDAWVVDRAVELLARRPDVSLFVNVSGSTLGHEPSLETIVERVRRSRIGPGQLSFEITETTAARDIPAAREWMWRLKELGCRFALDDFGMGFSSFAYLQSLPADFVKIDGSFIRGIGSNPANRALVKAIVDVSRALGKDPIAEWVEDLSSLPLLVALGVGLGQGYALGRPEREIPFAEEEE